MDLQVTGRIIIDAEAFGNFNPHRTEGYEELHKSDYIESDVPATNAPAINNYAKEEMSPTVNLTKDAHLICKPTLLGYSLKLKKWSKYSTGIIPRTVHLLTI